MTKLSLSAPSFAGIVPMLVGGSTFSATPGSKVVRVERDGGELVWILDLSNQLHCLVGGGEVNVPDAIVGPVRAKYFGQ